MDKKHFDHIENRIRQASDDIIVPVNEEAWRKMEVLLDDAFKKERRRGGIWWWFFGMLLIVGGLFGSVYLYQNRTLSIPADNALASQSPGSSINASTAKKAEGTRLPGQTAVAINAGQQERVSKSNEILKKKYLPIKTSDRPLTPDRQEHSALSVNIEKRRNAHEVGSTKKSNSPGAKVASTTNAVRRSDSKRDMQFSLNGDAANQPDTREHVSSSKKNDDTVNDYSITDRTDATMNDKSRDNTLQNSSGTPLTLQDSSDQQNTATKKSPPIRLAKTSRGFYFTVAAAADASGIKRVAVDNFKPVYGAGIGYRFNKKISIQTGFYAGKKIYQAGPDDYKVKPGSYIAKIISADAECVIYDIPLTLKYDFFQRRTYNIYATTGLSSFILKRETYDMHFFNPMGTYRHMAYTYKDNTNYLSVFNLSLGFEHKISNAFFLQAEPYIKLPIAGLGEGDVKLYSAGLQLGFKYQPLTNKKRKK